MLPLLVLLGVLGPLAQAPRPASAAWTDGHRRDRPSITDQGRMPRPEDLQALAGSGASWIVALGPVPGAAGAAVAGTPGAAPPLLWHVHLADPVGTGFDESFLLQVPSPAAQPAPLLVAFHGFGVSEQSIFTQTTFPAECAQRGWFLLAPLGATQGSFSNLQSQAHLEYVLELLLAIWPAGIDRERIYAAGFSMGGGAALNYAARHLDPARPRIAAVANHTGGVALLDSYANEPAAQWIFELWFHGPPSGSGFLYLRSSLFDFDPSTLVVDGSTDLLRNLVHVPVRSSYAQFDPLKYLLKQNDALHAHLTALGGTSQLVTTSGVGHTWGTLNEAATCDWLAQHVLATPSTASTLADHDGRYFHFDVEQDAALGFTPFTWSVDEVLNRLDLSGTGNLRRLAVDTLAAGLDPRAPLEVALATQDGLGDEVLLAGYVAAPSVIDRDGLPVAPADFAHDPVAGTLLLIELDGTAPHVWRVAP